MHARHSKCFWNRYNVAWPLTRQPEKCWHQLCAAPVSRYDVTQYHSTCRCDGGNTSAADVGDAYSRPGGCYRHIVVEVAIFFVKEETRRNTINTCRLYICSAQYASNDRESLKPLWDTAGLRNDSRSKTHMLFIFGLSYSCYAWLRNALCE